METLTRPEEDEEIEEEIQLDESRIDEPAPDGSRRPRGVSVMFSSPLASVAYTQHHDDGQIIWTDASQFDFDHSNVDYVVGPEQTNSIRTSSRRTSAGAGRLAYRGVSRRLSLGGQSFNARPVSRIDEQSEGSFMSADEDKENRRVSLAVSSPKPLCDITANVAITTPAANRSNVTFHLSPLPDFSLHQVDPSLALEVDYAVTNRGNPTNAREATLSVHVHKLLRRLTDVEPFEPYWDYIRSLELCEKDLDTVHSLDRYCSRIEQLNISGNHLDQLNGAPSSLRQLSIARNCLSSMTSWAHLTNLQYLDVSGNDIESLDCFKPLMHLRELNVDNNKVRSLSGIRQLDGLIKLSLKGNLLERVDFEGYDL
jgi:hypothetical protein